MLLTTSWDSTLKVFDEEDPDETYMLRKSSGGHFKDDISSIAFNDHLSLIATGSRSGIVCLWDFETNKLEGICLGLKRGVSSLNFSGEYPVLVGTGFCGIISIWAVRPSPINLRNLCLGRFISLGWNGENFTNIGITSSMLTIVEKKKDYSSDEPEVANAVTRIKHNYTDDFISKVFDI